MLHHTPDIDRSVAEVHRVLRPGGTAYVMLYHRDSLVNLVHRAFRLPYESPRDRKDHCPVVYTFSRRRRDTCSGSSPVSASTPTIRSPTGSGRWRPGLRCGPDAPLGRAIGWHLMITASRRADDRR